MKAKPLGNQPWVASAIAPASQGLISFHGIKDCRGHSPAVQMLLCSLQPLRTFTTVRCYPVCHKPSIIVNGRALREKDRRRVIDFLHVLQDRFQFAGTICVRSRNTFPSNCGLGTSGSAFASLTLAVATAARARIDIGELARLARIGSVSAGHSIVGGVSLGFPAVLRGSEPVIREIEPKKLNVGIIAVVVRSERRSLDLHSEARQSQLYPSITKLLRNSAHQVIVALHTADWWRVGQLVERNVAMNNALISTGPSQYTSWKPETLTIMDRVRSLRRRTEVPFFYALNGGPSVFCYAPRSHIGQLRNELRETRLPLIEARPCGGAVAQRRHLS